MTTAKSDIRLPPPGKLAYLIPLSRQCGRFKVGDMGGIQVVPHSEIRAFAARERLEPNEERMLRSMSEAYVDGYQLGHDVFSIPPWSGQ